MADSTGAAPKPSSSVKLVLLGEAAVGKVCWCHFLPLLRRSLTPPPSARAPHPPVHVEFNRLTDTVYLVQSSLVLRFVNNDFQENKEPTIGGACSCPTIPLRLVLLRFFTQLTYFLPPPRFFL